MLILLRAFLSVSLLAGLLWASFVVPLGGFTFAQHVDAIARTPEARALLDGTRQRVVPVLNEAKDAVSGLQKTRLRLHRPHHEPDKYGMEEARRTLRIVGAALMMAARDIRLDATLKKELHQQLEPPQR